MDNKLLNCWGIQRCGREKGGNKESVFCECQVSKENMGHSCWAVPGTFCDGEIKGIVVEKVGTCSSCQVYALYNRKDGTTAKEVVAQFPEEEKYNRFIPKL